MNKNLNIKAIGEVLWDMLPEGKRLGGAPANFIFYCQELGANAQLISAVGNDDLGEELLSSLALDTLEVRKNEWPTGQVEVVLEEGIPDYDIHMNAAWDYISISDESKREMNLCDAFCFGTLAQRSSVSRKSIQYVLSQVSDSCMRIFDVNLRQDYFNKEIIHNSLLKTDLLKINDEELTVLSELFGIQGTEIEQVDYFRNNYHLQWIALTKGSEGSVLFSQSEINHQPIVKTEVVDTIGAGDAFLAGLVVGLLSGFSLNDAHRQACELSSFVCSNKGSMCSINN